ncbi:restriction endonuclease subunit S [Bacillus thuringiensis]|uniref:restriction endonuclease subunit S n=1 Tax=Bacillus thuringiensis TaxID=1428 RepID=UPI0011A76EC6|nr:restriction endonuclease subunit S [Bacillus thuringiensis]
MSYAQYQNTSFFKRLPINWRLKTFNDAVKDITSGNVKLKKEDYQESGIYPIVDQGKELIAGYTDDDICIANNYECIVFGDHTRIFKYVDFNFVLGADGVKVLVPKAGDIEVKYLYYFFQTLDIPNTGYNRHFKYLKDVIIPLPPLEEQKKIARVLDKAQSLIDKRKEAIAKLDELLKSKFGEMFGDPINNPKGWEVKKLKTISKKILSGNTPKGGSEVYVDEGIMFFRSQNVWKNKLVLEDVAYIDKETHDKMGKSSLRNRDILMTKTGRINTENSSLGRAAMFLGEDDSANINGHVYLIRLQKEIVHEFVLFILTTDEYREYIRGVCVGGIDKRQINKEHLEEFPIIFPPIKLQNQFSDFVKQVNKLKFEMEAHLKEIENNFNALLQQAFKGELSIKDEINV